jgi:hypothetical protein
MSGGFFYKVVILDQKSNVVEDDQVPVDFKKSGFDYVLRHCNVVATRDDEVHNLKSTNWHDSIITDADLSFWSREPIDEQYLERDILLPGEITLKSKLKFGRLILDVQHDSDKLAKYHSAVSRRMRDFKIYEYLNHVHLWDTTGITKRFDYEILACLTHDKINAEVFIKLVDLLQDGASLYDAYIKAGVEKTSLTRSTFEHLFKQHKFVSVDIKAFSALMQQIKTLPLNPAERRELKSKLVVFLEHAEHAWKKAINADYVSTDVSELLTTWTDHSKALHKVQKAVAKEINEVRIRKTLVEQLHTKMLACQRELFAFISFKDTRKQLQFARIETTTDFDAFDPFACDPFPSTDDLAKQYDSINGFRKRYQSNQNSISNADLVASYDQLLEVLKGMTNVDLQMDSYLTMMPVLLDTLNKGVTHFQQAVASVNAGVDFRRKLKKKYKKNPMAVMTAKEITDLNSSRSSNSFDTTSSA